MPSFSNYKKIISNNTVGRIHKNESDLVYEMTWDNDIQSTVGYLYDYYHDDEKLKYYNLNPTVSKSKFPVDIKFIVSAHHSEAKDQVGYYIQFKPSFRWKDHYEINYYSTVFEKKYNSEFPLGMYIDIPDEKGIYRKWIVVDNGDWLVNQFPTWYILPVDHIFQWIFEDVRYQMCGVIRSQNSYNSGEWGDYKLTTVENQKKCILPMNDISSTIFYNQRIIISAPRKEPVAWHCSKVEQTTPKGLSKLTFVQDLWNEHTDVFEYDDGNFSNVYDASKYVVGMWADYKLSNIKPDDSLNVPSNTGIFSVITYTGTKSELKIGGSYKKFTVSFFNNSQDNPIGYISGSWSFTIDNQDASALVSTLDQTTSTELSVNQIKVKFLKNDLYIGKIMTIKFTTTTGVSSSVDIELKAL